MSKTKPSHVNTETEILLELTLAQKANAPPSSIAIPYGRQLLFPLHHFSFSCCLWSGKEMQDTPQLFDSAPTCETQRKLQAPGFGYT